MAPDNRLSVLAATICAGLIGLLAWIDWPHPVAHAARPAMPTPSAATHPAAPNRMIEWLASRDGNPRTYQSGGVTVRLSTRPGEDGPIPVLQLTGPGGETLRFAGQEGLSDASARFGVGRLDSRVAVPQVLFTSYSQGAHCCTQVTLFELVAGHWRTIDMQSWDGEPLTNFPTDLDGDGVRDILMNDDRFGYAFASHAESLAPVRIFNIVDGTFVDVSASPRYHAVFQRDLREAQTGCAEHSNGACAAFVAIAARLGRADWAWPIMLAGYDRHSDWTYPTDCRVPLDAQTACPENQTITFRDMPQALSWFLRHNGYTRTLIAPIR